MQVAANFSALECVKLLVEQIKYHYTRYLKKKYMRDKKNMSEEDVAAATQA